MSFLFRLPHLPRWFSYGFSHMVHPICRKSRAHHQAQGDTKAGHPESNGPGSSAAPAVCQEIWDASSGRWQLEPFFFGGGNFRSFPKDQDKRWIFFWGIIYGPMVSGKFSVGLWFPVFGGRLLIFPRPIGSKSAPRTAGICWRASTMGARLPTITSPHPLSPQNNHHGSKMAMFSLAMGPNWVPQSLHH